MTKTLSPFFKQRRAVYAEPAALAMVLIGCGNSNAEGESQLSPETTSVLLEE